MSRRGRLVAVLSLSWCSARAAHADVQACNDAYEQAQVSRQGNQLIEARKFSRICVNDCSHWSKKQACGEWLARLESEIPSIVLTANDPSGKTLLEATVTMDEKLLATRLDGRPIEIDPGVHLFKF